MEKRELNIEGLAKGIVGIVAADAINARLEKKGLSKIEDHQQAALTLVKAEGIKSQGEATVLVVNLTQGKVDADQMTKILQQGFPGAKIGSRHGPHYLSLARTGKLEGVEVGTIPHRARKQKAASTPAPAVVVPAIAQPTAEAPVEPEPKPTDGPTETTTTEPVVEANPVEARREALLKLNQKDLAAEAKKVGVKSTGKAVDVVERILAAAV